MGVCEIKLPNDDNEKKKKLCFKVLTEILQKVSRNYERFMFLEFSERFMFLEPSLKMAQLQSIAKKIKLH